MLVADDHGVTRFGLVQFLRSKLGATSTHEAGRFEDAINVLEKQRVDLAVFDLGIPGLQSPRDLSRIRDRWPATKLVVLSGSDAREDILSALEARVHGYFIKTEPLDDLAERLGHVMAGEIYVPPCLAEPGNGASPAPAPVSAHGSPKLTQRQLEVLSALVRGLPNKQIAKELELSLGTVKMHVSAVLTALGAKNRLQAASIGRKLLE